jgi:DUF4097 and DUF4098 domain-containing protein YvlB
MIRVSKISLHAAALFLLALFLLPQFASARKFESEEKFEYQVEEDFQLTVANSSGTISVAPSHDGKLNVTVLKIVDAGSNEEAAEISDELDVVIEATESDVSIKVHYPVRRSDRSFWKQVFGFGGDGRGEVHLELKVPTSVELLISSASADVYVGGVEGEFRFELTSGDIKLSELTGFCQIETTSGDIEARDIKGDLTASSTSSDGHFDNIDGDLEVESISGDTEIRWVSGDARVGKTSGDTRIEKSSGNLEVSSTSGDIWIVQREGSFWVKTTSGDIHVESELAGGDDFEIATVSGDITLRFPEETNADIRASTSSGEIDAEAGIEILSLGRNQLEGTIGRGGKRLQLSSSSGDIRIVTY